MKRKIDRRERAAGELVDAIARIANELEHIRDRLRAMRMADQLVRQHRPTSTGEPREDEG